MADMLEKAALPILRQCGSYRLRPAKLVGLVAVVLTLLLCSARPVHAQTTSQYTTTATGAITDLSCNQPVASQIVRTFNVSTSFIVGDVNIGIFLDHSYRSDLRIFLTSPAGTTVSILPWTTNAQSSDNLNDLFDDEAVASISTHNGTVDDPLAPAPAPPGTAYSHSFQPANPFTAFDGQNALGNWSLRICDAINADTGNFRRADLFIASTSLSIAKASSVISDGISGANPKALPGAVVQYCILVTNNGTTATAAHSNVAISDPLPANSSYVTGSMRSGTSCAGANTIEDEDNAGADESDPFGMSLSGTTLTGRTSSLAANGTFALVFRVTLN